MMDKVLSSKTILITGGTSRLGRAFVQKALAAGGRVFFTTYQNQTEAESLQKLGAEGFSLNLSDRKQIEAFCAQLKTKIDHLDVLIHNAAAIRDHTVQNLTDEDWDYVMSVNLKGPYYLTKKLMPLLLQRRSVIARRPKADEAISEIASVASLPRNDNNGVASKIFFITSRAAVTGGYGISNYAASKAGLIGLTKSLAQELGKRQILVNAVNPGFMKSKMTENLPEAVLQHHLDLSPLARYSDPEEAAGFLMYLSSDAMTQVTGQVLHFESRKS